MTSPFNLVPIKKMIFRPVVFLAAALILSPFSAAHAATASLMLTPASGSYQVGDSFSVNTIVSCSGAAINAAEGLLRFNPNELTVVSVSKSGSIFTLWTADPSFSNTAGTINFGGGLQSGFNGASGKILTIKFMAKSAASARVDFGSGSVLAADGMGTDILSSKEGGIYTITPKTTPVTPKEEIPPVSSSVEKPLANPQIGLPKMLIVKSNTHPSPDEWYANNSPEFFWDVPTSVNSIRMSIDQQPDSAPSKIYAADITSKKIDNLSDGVWYFHIQAGNDAGWGPISHRKVMIDTKAPEPFEVTVDNGGDPTDPAPQLRFKTTDTTSGIAYYELKIGSGDKLIITPNQLKDDTYKTAAQTPGLTTVIVKAFDFAKNTAVATMDATIQPLTAPKIDPLPKSMREGDLLTVRGSSEYPQAKIELFVKKDGEEVSMQEVDTDGRGNWDSVYQKSLNRGAYKIWAEVIDSRAARSLPSQEVTLAVLPPVFVRIGTIVIDYFGVFMLLIGLVLIFAIIVCVALILIAATRRRLRSKTENLAKQIFAAFDSLRQKLRDQIEYLDGKSGLSKSEKVIYDNLKKALDDSEKIISKEIKDVEKDLK